MSGFDGTIEVVRGRLTAERAEQLVAFWTDLGVLDERAARERLRDVVCVLVDPVGAIAGVNSVFAEALPLVGGRRFWIYRSVLRTPAAGADDAMVRTAFRTLDGEHEPGRGGPIGLCLLVGDPDVLARRPQAVWEDPRFLYAGYLDDGRQVRIAYFAGATVGHG